VLATQALDPLSPDEDCVLLPFCDALNHRHDAAIRVYRMVSPIGRNSGVLIA
jgi:hypothetical protein